jgi:zinc D-Ala-D-Ala carboxypeptidase
MKKTFREKVIFGFGKFIKRHKLLKYPCLILMSILLGCHWVVTYFAGNGKRYASIALLVLFFMNSCSFSFAVFAEKTGFITVQETYSAVVEDSDVMLAVEKETVSSQEELNEGEEAASICSGQEDMEGVDTYTADDILESQEVQEETEPGLEETDGEEAVTTDNVEYHFDASDWRLVLVNKQHPIPEDYEFTLGTITGSMQCDERIIDDLLAMLQAAKKEGVNLAICSPYRNLDRQENLFNKKIKLYMGQGMSYMEAYKIASQAVTIPGASEHQMGLALDIFSDTYTSLDEGFADTEAGKWLAEHSCEYGFVLRYPKGKEYITSIEFEPWHFRYVGTEAAYVMTRDNICLEEFWEKYL